MQSVKDKKCYEYTIYMQLLSSISDIELVNYFR